MTTNISNDEIIVSEELETLIKSLKKNKPAYNVGILRKAILVAQEKEKHAKKDELINFLNGKYYDQLARAEKDPEKKLLYINEVKKYLVEEDVKRLDGVSIAARMEILLQSKEKSLDELTEGLGNFSQEFQKAGHDRDAKLAMVLKKMYEAGKLFETNRPEALSSLEEAEKICVEEGNIDGAHKMRSLKYSLEARYQPTPQQSVEFMKKSLEEVEKTKDKYGKIRAEAEIHYLQAFVTTDLEEKINHFFESGKLYISDNFDGLGQESIARANQLSVHKPGISIEEVQRYQKKSAEAYEKAGLKRMAHNMRGGYYGTLAVKRGLFDGKRRWFLRYSFMAIDEFKAAGNISEFNYLMGNVALVMSKNLSDSERIDHLEIASSLLNQSKKGSGDFASYQLFLSKSNLEGDLGKQREYREKALKYLINFTNQLEKDIADKSGRKEIVEWMDTQKPLLLNLKADTHRLRSILLHEKSEIKLEQEKAKSLLEEIECNFPDHKLMASFNLGMIYIEMEEFDKAILQFRKALLVDPSNQQVKSALEYSQQLLVKGFREMKNEREIQNEFTSIYNILDVGQVPTHLEKFVSKVTRIIINRGQGFERSPGTYSKKGETELRDEILQDLNKNFPGDATAETIVGNGKTDLRIKNPIDPNDEAIGECKLWGGQKAYLEAKDQLLGYLPPERSYGFQITFSDNKDFNAVYEQAKESITNLSDYEPASIRETVVFGGKKCLFTTKHKFNKNGHVFIHHILFNLYHG